MEADELFQRTRTTILAAIDSAIEEMRSAVGSPIEATVAAALFEYLRNQADAIPTVDRTPAFFPGADENDGPLCAWVVAIGEEIRVWFQPKIYIRPGQALKPDFGIEIDRGAGWGSVRVAVECDGHDFHEKTKEQAARDKRRDRELMECGWPVLRFTGSEIHANPVVVVRDIFRVLEEKRRELDEAIEQMRRRGQ